MAKSYSKTTLSPPKDRWRVSAQQRQHHSIGVAVPVRCESRIVARAEAPATIQLGATSFYHPSRNSTLAGGFNMF